MVPQHPFRAAGDVAGLSSGRATGGRGRPRPSVLGVAWNRAHLGPAPVIPRRQRRGHRFFAGDLGQPRRHLQETARRRARVLHHERAAGDPCRRHAGARAGDRHAAGSPCRRARPRRAGTDAPLPGGHIRGVRRHKVLAAPPRGHQPQGRDGGRGFADRCSLRQTRHRVFADRLRRDMRRQRSRHQPSARRRGVSLWSGGVAEHRCGSGVRGQPHCAASWVHALGSVVVAFARLSPRPRRLRRPFGLPQLGRDAAHERGDVRQLPRRPRAHLGARGCAHREQPWTDICPHRHRVRDLGLGDVSRAQGCVASCLTCLHLM
mmetsp:Transcript_55376/g.153323  ORF Transcript_55376/g.153323 Transcript_55376/m.153323 type:complete len:319 (+) Transcript_55376:646-1602(+)